MKNKSNNAQIPSLAVLKLMMLWMRFWFFFHDQGLEDFIKNAVRETYDGYATDKCKHFGVKVGTLLALGKIPDQVISYW